MSVFDALNKPLTFAPRPVKTDVRPPRSKIEVGSVPRVNLMPPSVEADRRMRRGVRMAGVAVVLSLVVAGAGVAYGGFVAMQSAGALLAENARTADLLTTQTEYAEVSQALGSIDRVAAAQALVGAQDVQWAPYVGDLAALLPDGARFSNVSIQASTPLEAFGASAESTAGDAAPIDPTVIGMSEITVRTRDLASVDAWIDKLSKAVGYHGAMVTNVTQTDGVYDATVAVGIGQEALSQRYAASGSATDSADSSTSATTGTEN
jgi:Tfp pilus assembly protein PilN